VATKATSATSERRSVPRRSRPTDPRIQARRVSVARQYGRRRRRRIMAMFVAIALIGIGFDLVHSSVFGARNIEVIGAPNIATRTLIAVAGLRSAPPLVDLDASLIAARVEHLPWVANADVRIAWPSTVSIRVTERVPVAAIPSGQASGVSAAARSYAICDATGRILEIVATRPASLPIVILASGQGSSTALVPGAYLPASGRVLAAVAAAMPESMVGETAAITSDSLGVVVDLPGRPLAIIGGANALQQKFVSLATVLAHGHLSGIATIDLRVPTAPLLVPKRSSRIAARKVGG
jgi:cell division septal protein FtsQ